MKEWDWLRVKTAKTLEKWWARRCPSHFFSQPGWCSRPPGYRCKGESPYNEALQPYRSQVWKYLSGYSVRGKDEQMVAPLDRVIEAALALPESERAELVDTLIATFAPEDAAPLDNAWLAEINRRSDEFDAGGVLTLSWAEVKERARQRRASHDYAKVPAGRRVRCGACSGRCRRSTSRRCMRRNDRPAVPVIAASRAIPVRRCRLRRPATRPRTDRPARPGGRFASWTSLCWELRPAGRPGCRLVN